jgi:hypothetical protein
MKQRIRDIQHIKVEKVIEIVEYDDKDVVTHQNVAILVRHGYVLTRFVILDVVVMKVDTWLTCIMELIDS